MYDNIGNEGRNANIPAARPRTRSWSRGDAAAGVRFDGKRPFQSSDDFDDNSRCIERCRRQQAALWRWI